MTGCRSIVGVARAEVGAGGDELATLALGSCVAVLLHDPEAGVGGLAHVLLPEPPQAGERVNPARFAATAVPFLLERMEALGASRGRLSAVLVGGASMFPGSATMNVGARNVAAARRALREARIPIRAEDVGRDHSRSVYLDTASGRVRVSAAELGESVL